jgi:ferredoxin
MARVLVDKDMCTGHARCNAVSPEVFPLDDDGFVAVTDEVVDDDAAQDAEAGAFACPERAIRVTAQ